MRPLLLCALLVLMTSPLVAQRATRTAGASTGLLSALRSHACCGQLFAFCSPAFLTSAAVLMSSRGARTSRMSNAWCALATLASGLVADLAVDRVEAETIA